MKNKTMIEKEFAPYEQALALKELGFDEPCFAGYQKNKKIYYCKNNNWFTNFDVNPDVETLNLHIKEYPKNVILINGKYFLHSCSNFTAPLYQQAFRWFREKYKIRFIIQSSMSDLGEFFKVIFPNGEQRGVSYNTYEEAELECLKQLIEIVKNK